MIWLASFPRSGNTFFRIVLHQVYGIPSSEFEIDPGVPVDPEYAGYPAVKTHLLPRQLVPDDPEIPAVYLVRDGRDAVVSLARHRTDIVSPGSHFEVNLQEAIIADRGSFFGGWSRHVTDWLERASVVIRFEELIEKPIESLERIRPWVDLPEPDTGKLPTFRDLKEKEMPYGAFRDRYFGDRQWDFSPREEEELRRKFFRRGKIGAWKDEMPYELHELFWELHGGVMEKLGYRREVVLTLPEESARYTRGTARDSRSPGEGRERRGRGKKRVLVEASPLMMGSNDGCQRYVADLLKGLLECSRQPGSKWDFQVHLGMRAVFDIGDLEEIIGGKTFSLSGTEGKGAGRIRMVGPFLASKNRLAAWIIRNLPDPLVDLLKKLNRSVQVYLWDHVRTVDFSRYDLVHLTVPQFYPALRHCRAPLVTTIFDLTHLRFPRYHLESNVLRAEEGIRFALDRGSALIAISQSTRSDLLGSYEESRGNLLETVHLGCDRSRFHPAADEERLESIRRKYGIPEVPYLLSLGTLEPRKNVENTIRAFLKTVGELPETEAVLVVSGRKGWKWEALFEDPDLRSLRVKFTGFVEEEDLAALYSGALAFCYVSWYEGFGLPALEAMSCGTPVIYGNNSSLPEVVGDGGMPAEPGDVGDIGEKMKKMILDREAREALSLRALERAREFTPERVLEGTLAAYDRVISAARSKPRES